MNEVRDPNKPATGVSKEAVEHEINTEYLVDETGAHIEVPEEDEAVQATHGEPSVGATGPTNWWRTGIVVLGLLILLMLVLQVMTGGGAAPTAS